MTEPKLPSDVFKDSGFRLPLPKRELLDDDAKQIFDHFKLEFVVDCEKAFKDVLLEQVIVIGKKK